MDTQKIISEISEILMLENNFITDETPIEFDSLSSLMLVEFLDSNFKILISKEEIKEFNVLKDVIKFIDDRKS